MVDAVREEDSSSQNVNIYITAIHTKEAFTEVSISTGASFFISDSDYRVFPFRKGDAITPDVVENLEKGHKLILCRSKALSLLDLAEHSAFMLRTKLRQRGFEAPVVESVIAQLKEIPNVDIKNIYTGNGASELIQLALNALLDSGDEVLVPSPDYPLWTAFCDQRLQ